MTTQLTGSSAIAFVGVKSLDEAEQFYGDVLGLELSDQRPFALVAQAGDSMLRISAVGDVAPVAHTVAGWKVPDISACVTELTARGVVFNRYEGLEQDERGIWRAPGGAQVAWFLDPDGNNLSLTQFA